MTDLAIIVPVLRRPQNVAPLIESIAATTADWSVLFVCDPDDSEEHDAIRQTDQQMIAPGGNYAHKINCGVLATTAPLIFTGADDLRFHGGWLEKAKQKLTPGIGVVGTNDLCNARTMKGIHSTHSLVTREYAQLGTIDQPDRLLHEGYPHEFVDDEFVATAKSRGSYAHALESIVEHLHPQVGKAPSDALYAEQPRRMRAGRRLYLKREPLWAT